MVFMLAMVLHPRAMHRAQSEIDRVIGRDRMPALSDMDRLPYVAAVINEVLRWRPVAPLCASVVYRVITMTEFSIIALPKRCMQVRAG